MARRRNSGREVYQTDLLQAMRKCLPTRGLPLISEDGRVRWTPRVLVMTVILLVWTQASTLLDAFTGAREVVVGMYDSRRRPGRSLQGFLAALAKSSAELVAAVTASLREALPRVAGRHWRLHGYVVMGVDGSKIECPRTRANERAFECSGKPGTTPQMLLTLLFHVGTGLPWAWRRGSGKGSERADLTSMLGDLPRETLLLADAGFVGYEMLLRLMEAGQEFIVRAGRNVRLLQRLGFAVEEHAGLVYLWPEGKRGRPPLVLRLVTVRTGKRTMALLTSVLDGRRLSDAAVADLYRLRWGVEVLYRTLKQTLECRKMLSTTPAHAAMELDWAVIGLWMLGQMAAEARGRGRRPSEWSAARALRVVRKAMRHRDRPRPAGGLRRQLRRSVKDAYVRHRAKTARYWPRKKNESPPGLPKIRMATHAERLKAQGFLSCVALN